MAKINVYVPEPPAEYSPEGFRQINQALETVENQLNTSYQNKHRFNNGYGTKCLYSSK